MSRPSTATPCPAPSNPARRVSFASFDGTADDTAAVEFTRAIDHEILNAKPRRRQSINGVKRQKTAPITIFEDVLEGEELVVDANKKLEGKTLLGKPAQRIRNPALVKKTTTSEEALHPLRESGQVRRRSSIMPMDRMHLSAQTGYAASSLPADRGMKRDSRRRTIFVPTDDTTVMTIHPGANATERLNDTFHLPNIMQEQSSEAVSERDNDDYTTISLKQPLRRPRKSLAAAPKRMPLAQMEARQNVYGVDMPGQGGGKENHPPSSNDAAQGKKEAEHSSKTGATSNPPATSWTKEQTQTRATALLPRPNATSRNRQSLVAAGRMTEFRSTDTNRPQEDRVQQQSISAHLPSATRNLPNHDLHSRPLNNARPAAGRSPSNAPGPTPAAHKSQLRGIIAAKRNEMQNAKVRQYPVLSEDLACPELYEDGWLCQQEAALTEVINEIFATKLPSYTDQELSPKALREAMIEIYHQPETSMLYKRLQASLLYGALKRPKDLVNPLNLSQDLGLRKRFISLWLDAYEVDTLRTAAEVVVGRQIPDLLEGSATDSIKTTEHLLDPLSGRRAITSFLETFFVAVSDSEFSEASLRYDEGELQVIRWRKTMLRSLMLVWLLDQAKTSGAIRGCLFKSTSPRKSSSAVLQALSSLLIPSVGDMSRALRHMDYEVTSTQGPLDDVVYRIDNLAVDLRDGIILSRLVELLLYSRRFEKSRSRMREATITITLPDATILESCITGDNLPYGPPRTLSQHMKIPAIGRAQKLHNIQVSLSALESHDLHAANVVGDITPADLVDGHRERTLSLLWSLVSVYGLDQLVDWKSLHDDTLRLHSSPSNPEPDMHDDLLHHQHPESLLRAWANAYAVHAQLPPVRNLTTSFADGSVYGAIVEGFAAYISSAPAAKTTAAATTMTATEPAAAAAAATAAGPAALTTRLRALGCSTAFTSQLASTLALVPSRQTTLSNLAFLASRLLPLARADLAARKLQRAFRLRRARLAVTRRLALARLAHACALVVGTRERLEAAAVVLQRAWRRALDVRVARLEAEVVAFQTVARGWAVRTGLRGAAVGTRVRGGWC